MSRAVLSIGSNVGDSLGHLRSVVAALGDRLVAASPVYSTAPWGGVEQQDFLNATVVADDETFGPRDWLQFGRRLEAEADRVRIERWGPRSLDVDVVACDDVISTDPELILPHPRAHERAFVLIPWLDVQPDAQLVVDGIRVRVAALLNGLTDTERDGVVRTELLLTPGATPGEVSDSARHTPTEPR